MSLKPLLLSWPSFQARMGSRWGATLILLAAVALRGDAQTLLLSDAKVDAGTVSKGTAIKKDFIVKNSGSADLRISEVKPACGCMVATFDKVIAPGAEGRISVTVDTKSFQGPITKTALVMSNDPATPSTTISLVANVKPYVNVTPGFFRIQAIAGQPASSEVTIDSDDPAFKPTGVKTPSRHLSASLVPGQASGQWKLVLTSDSSAPEGLVGGYVTIQTGLRQQPELNLAISGYVKRPEPAREGAPSDRISSAGPASGTMMTNEQVIELAKGGLSEEVIVNSLNQASGADFDLTSTGLLALKKAGVSDKVIIAMQSRRAAAPSGATTSGGEPPRAVREKSTAESSSSCADVDFLGVILAVSGGGQMAGRNAYGGRVRNRASYTKEVDFTWTMNGRPDSGTFRVPAGQFIDVNLGQGSMPPTNVRLVACR